MTNALKTNERVRGLSSIQPSLLRVRHSLGKLRNLIEVQWALRTQTTDRLMQRRFNTWAKRGRGEAMAHHHAQIAETIWERMQLSASDRILDLGCGEGWACRLLEERAPRGCLVFGLDISDEMIRLARKKSASLPNVSYHCGTVQQIPQQSDYFTKVFSIEAFYYFEQQEQALREILRVTQPGGHLYLLLCLFQDDPKPQSWFDDVALPVQNLSISEYERMLRRTGWTEIACHVFDFASGVEHKRDAHDRPLLVTARKPG